MKRIILLLTFLCLGLSGFAGEPFKLSWTNNLLTVTSSDFPGGKLEIWYLEAFCRTGSTHQDWGKTTLPHRTVLLQAEPEHLRFKTKIQPDVEVDHEVFAHNDELEFTFQFKNLGTSALDIDWFQPACIRVAAFTGSDQTNYISKSFIFTKSGLTTLNATGRREEAIYHGGQVYVPAGINLSNVDPRPLAMAQPTNGLIGCFSADGKQLLATASSTTQELFEGVYVCLHSDPRIGGLAPGETKNIRAKIYLLKNDPEQLLRRYQKDFGKFQ